MERMLEWRGRARIVAYVDLILTSMAMLMVVFAAAFTSIFTAVAVSPNLETHSDLKEFFSKEPAIDPTAQEALGAISGMLWTMVVLFAVITAIQLWAAIKLMNGTDVGKEHDKALKKATVWRNITLVFLTINVAVSLLMESYLTLITNALIRGCCLYVVHNFMKELNSRLNPIPPPVEVTFRK